jgi:hypothetical protein
MGQVTTVTIATVVYSIYGEHDPDAGTTQPSAGEYLNGSIRWADSWAALSPDQQARALVEATRFIDAQRWAGEPTSPSQPLAWPRTGVVRADGTAVDPATVPDEVVQATYLLAAMLSEDSEALDQPPSTGGNIQRVKAGPAEVEFHRPMSGGIFPSSLIQSLLGQFLDGASPGSYGLGAVSGANENSSFDEDSDFYLVGGPAGSTSTTTDF